MTKERRGNRDIRNLLVVLGSSIGCAVLIAFLLIYHYGPSGRYIAGQTILDPATIEHINEQEINPRNPLKLHFVFDQMVFSYFDPHNGQVRKVPVGIESYQTFYQRVYSEKSLPVQGDEVEHLFIRSRPTFLTLQMRTLNQSKPSHARIFQVIEFIKEDYFRVHLHEHQEQGGWVYFYKQNIYRDIMGLFTETVVTSIHSIAKP